MYKECKTTQSANRQRGIAKTLSEMMLTKPYEEISVSELCKKADIPRKSFYRYFDTKEDTLNFLIDKVMIEGGDFNNGINPADRILDKEMLESRFRYFKEHSSLIGAIANNQLSLLAIQRICRMVVNDMNEFGVKISIEEEMKTTMIVSVVFGTIMAWHHSGYSTPCSEMAEKTYAILTKPLIEDGKAVF